MQSLEPTGMSLPKHRNLLILAVLAIPLVLNMFALWQAIGLETLGQAANGKYQPFGVPLTRSQTY